MVTFLSGGTGTPKLLAGADEVFQRSETTVVGNTGEDIVLGGHLVCPDIDTVLFLDGGELDRETWWGIADDTAQTHEELGRLAEAADLERTPRYLPAEVQTDGRDIADWRRFSAVGEFMHIGDRDRAVHLTRTGLIDEGHSLTEATAALATAFGLERTLLPMSNEPVASLIHTPNGLQHFQEWWVGRGGEPPIESVEYRGAEAAATTQEVADALGDPVVIGPSNPVTSIGPMLALSGIRERLQETPVVVVSPFVEDTVFSGPAGDLMAATGREPSTAGVAAMYPFADAFVLDEADGTALDRPVVQTDTTLGEPADGARVCTAVADALEAVR
jgi:LPPG:FO 2-phospho-L-lactate transferase